MLRYHDYFLAHIKWRLKIGEERGPGELVRDPGKGDGKATLHLAWKICKVLIAFYNYLGAGRLSYPIHSRATLAHHPLLCFLAPSALLSWGFFFLVFSLSLTLCLIFSPSLPPSYPDSLAFAPSQLCRYLSLAPSHAFFVSLATELPAIRACVPSLRGAHVLMCLHLDEQEDSLVLASYTSYDELRSSIYLDIKNACSFQSRTFSNTDENS